MCARGSFRSRWSAGDSFGQARSTTGCSFQHPGPLALLPPWQRLSLQCSEHLEPSQPPGTSDRPSAEAPLRGLHSRGLRGVGPFAWNEWGAAPDWRHHVTCEAAWLSVDGAARGRTLLQSFRGCFLPSPENMPVDFRERGGGGQGEGAGRETSM